MWEYQSDLKASHEIPASLRICINPVTPEHSTQTDSLQAFLQSFLDSTGIWDHEANIFFCIPACQFSIGGELAR